MSDLASFVAATLRDKTVMELIEERDRLQQRVATLEDEVAQEVAHPTVSVTGPNGFPLFAKGKMEDGGPNPADDQRWIVDFTPQLGAASCSSIAQLKALEIRLCGRGKKVVVEGLEQLGCFMDYDLVTRRCNITLCICEPCISLFCTLGPFSLETCNALQQEHGEFELSTISEVFASTLGGDNATASIPITVQFDAIQFTHHCHTTWNDEDDDGDH